MRALLTLILASILAASVTVMPNLSAQAANTAPAFIAQGYVSGANEVKFPHLAVTGSSVHLAANINRADARYWRKLDADAGFGPATRVGPAEGQPDYSTTSIAVGPDNALAYVWVNQPASTIFLRTQAAGQEWTPAIVVASGQSFAVFPEVAWASDGALVVVWRTPDKPFVARRSTDGGASWGLISRISLGAGINQPALAAGPNGQLAVAYAQGSGDRIQVFVTTWGGSGFSAPQRISAANDNYADPAVSYAPDGRLYVAWRGVADRGATAGVFYSERQADGSWPIVHLIGGKVAGKVTILADTQRNLHAIWTASPSGDFQVWYSIKPDAGAWSAPVAAPLIGGTLFNASAAISIGADGTISANAVSEVFAGSSIFIRHYRFRSGRSAQAAPVATPILAAGAPTTAQTAVPVTFAGVAGAPTHVRVHWGATPTDVDPWQPFGPLSVPVPATVGGAGCAPLTLFTQTRGAGGLQVAPARASISIDRAVQATLTAVGAGAPGYANQPTVALQVDARADCSGIAAARLLTSTRPISPTESAFALQAPIRATEGVTQTVGVIVTDTLGATRTLTTSVVYDVTPPDFTPGGPLVITADPHASVLTSVRLQAGRYADASGERPWALQIAVTADGSPQVADPQTWATLPLTGEAGTDLTAQVSLGQFFSRSQLAPGRYTYTVRVLDMAGNPAATTAIGTISLNAITYVTVSLPLVRR